MDFHTYDPTYDPFLFRIKRYGGKTKGKNDKIKIPRKRRKPNKIEEYMQRRSKREEIMVSGEVH